MQGAAFETALDAIRFRREWLADYGEREYGDGLAAFLVELDEAEAQLREMIASPAVFQHPPRGIHGEDYV